MATEVRAGLVHMPGIERTQHTDSVLDRLEHRKPIRQHIREFACIFAIIALAYSGHALYTHAPSARYLTGFSLAGVLLFLGYVTPILLYPLWKGWMILAVALGFVVTSIILICMWLAVFVPLALLLRIIGKQVMDLSFDRSASSYWNERDEKFHDFKLLERQF